MDPQTIFTGLTTRLARMLLAIWTDPGQIVIDTTADPAVQAATESGGRTYVPLRLPLSAHRGTDLTARAGLILLRWPPPAPENWPHPGTVPAPNTTSDVPSTSPRSGEDTLGPSPDSLLNPGPILQACRDLLTPHGHTVVILAPPAAGHYRDYARDVIPAAHHAGLGYLQHLVVITSDTQPTAPGTDWLAHPRAHVDLLVFVIRAAENPRGSS